jgi:hypothetical protein
MTVRAKFKVNSVTKQEHWDKSKPPIVTITMQPVSGGSPENAAFYASTPGGEIKLNTLNGEVGDQLTLGVEFYVDFTPANAA